MVDLLYKYKVGTTAPPEGAFEQGKVGMILNGTWMGRDYEAALGDDLAAAPLPYKKVPASNTGGEHWMILPSDMMCLLSIAFKQKS
jgi:maltose-binding protein MalE